MLIALQMCIALQIFPKLPLSKALEDLPKDDEACGRSRRCLKKKEKEQHMRREAMVGGALARASAFRVGLGVSGATIVSGSWACPSHLWISRVLTSSSSLGNSSLFCRPTQCM
jgi:hypothetical protein